MLDDRLAEGLAELRVVGGEIERALGDADAARGDVDAAGAPARSATWVKPFAFDLADQVIEAGMR